MLDRWISVAQRRWAFWLCVLAVLALALLKPTHALPTTGWDKANHALAFGVMALLGAMAYPARLGRILLALLAYGVLIEILQGFTGYRDSDWHDVIADGAGLLLAWPVARHLVAGTLASRRAGAGPWRRKTPCNACRRGSKTAGSLDSPAEETTIDVPKDAAVRQLDR